jgi:hypothetical protein
MDAYMISWACSFMVGKVLKVKVFHVQDKVMDNYIMDKVAETWSLEVEYFLGLECI